MLENEILFVSREFKAINSEDSQLRALMEDQFLSLLLYVADQERKKILKRQKEGIAAARKGGKHLDRPAMNSEKLLREQRAILDANFEKWQWKEIKGVEFMDMLDLKKNTFYKAVKEYQ